MSNKSANWKVFDDWHLPPTEGQILPDWNSFDEMLSAFSGVLQELYSQLNELLEKWDHRLSVEFGMDPTYQDWREFRPLRLSREEDFSDWLAYLMKCSDTGVFACSLFRDSASARRYARPHRVEREVNHKERRADLIVHWSNATSTHIEIKVGDPDLEKTFSTSREMRELYHQPHDRWSNYILLPSNQIPDWERIPQVKPSEPPVSPVTWDDVSVALRRGLRSDETVLWKAFAYTMVGAIEQLLVGYPGYEHRTRSGDNLIASQGMEAKLLILRKGLEDDYADR